jgi:hypothetical protein
VVAKAITVEYLCPECGLFVEKKVHYSETNVIVDGDAEALRIVAECKCGGSKFQTDVVMWPSGESVLSQ